MTGLRIGHAHYKGNQPPPALAMVLVAVVVVAPVMIAFVIGGFVWWKLRAFKHRLMARNPSSRERLAA